jgi:hypothetical protein
MTESEATTRSSHSQFGSHTRLRSLAACFARALIQSRSLFDQRAQGRPGADWHPRSAARKAHAEKPHSSIQVLPNTRPSLRDGRTAYAVLSREPNFPLASLAVRIDDDVHPVGLARIFERLDRSNDGQDHTVSPYARPAMSPQYFQPCRRSWKLTGETKPSSAVRLHAGVGLTGTTRPARTPRANAAASTATRPAFRTTREPPLFVGPGCVDLCRNSEFR